MSIDLKHMVKVYNYVNDEKRHKFNYKFLGLFLALVAAASALVAFAAYSAGSGREPDPPSTAHNRTDYVGLSPGEAASAELTAATLQQRLDSWYASHPGADVKGIEPVYERGMLVGYLITYAAAS